MMDTWKLIEAKWNATGISHHQGLSEAELANFEKRHNIRLSTEVFAFYSNINGMASFGERDPAFITFWPLSEVGTVPSLLSDWRGIPDYGGIEKTLPEAASYFVFADHSIWLHVYAMKLTVDKIDHSQVIYISNGNTWGTVASSFDEFLRQYAEDSWSIMLPKQFGK